MSAGPVRQVLPEQIEFYHLGPFERIPLSGPPLSLQAEIDAISRQEIQGIYFRFFGDQGGLLLLFFETDLEQGIYSEFGNILASHIADYLSKVGHCQTLVSPPRHLQVPVLEKLDKMSLESQVCTYQYFHPKAHRPMQIRVWIFLNPMEGKGNV